MFLNVLQNISATNSVVYAYFVVVCLTALLGGCTAVCPERRRTCRRHIALMHCSFTSFLTAATCGVDLRFYSWWTNRCLDHTPASTWPVTSTSELQQSLLSASDRACVVRSQNRIKTLPLHVYT